MCVCVCECECESESESVCVCVCVHYSLLCVCTWMGEMQSTKSQKRCVFVYLSQVSVSHNQVINK